MKLARRKRSRTIVAARSLSRLVAGIGAWGDCIDVVTLWNRKYCRTAMNLSVPRAFQRPKHQRSCTSLLPRVSLRQLGRPVGPPVTHDARVPFTAPTTSYTRRQHTTEPLGNPK